jgi:hypothetical protein
MSQCETGRNGAFLNIPQLNFLMVGQSAVVEVERVNEFFARAAAEEARTIVRKFQTVETLGQRGVRNGFALCQVDNRNLMGAVAVVQDGGESAGRMDRDVDWKVPKFDLLAGWAERPLVWEEYGAVGLFAGKVRLNRGTPGRRVKDFDLVVRCGCATGQCQNYYQGEYECEKTHKTGAHGGLKIEKCKLKNANFR